MSSRIRFISTYDFCEWKSAIIIFKIKTSEFFLTEKENAEHS